MDDKRLEFVAMMLAREEIQHLNPEAIRKRVREASAAYDIMVEELGGLSSSGERSCYACAHYGVNLYDEPCLSCLHVDDKPNWMPA